MASAPTPPPSSDQPTSAPDHQPPADGIVRSAGRAGSATLASRILGLVRDQVLAAAFGAGNEMDAFVVAFRVPNLVRDLFAEGSMSAAFVPTFTRRLAVAGKADAWRLGNNVINALALVTGVIVVLGWVFATPIVTAYASDFRRVPHKLELTVQLTRIVLPFLTLAALAAAIMGMLNSLRHYFIPALAPAMFNVATILAVLAFTPLMPALGMPAISVLAFAAIAGGVGQIALQWPALHREGFRYRTSLDFRDPGLRQVLLLMGPGTLGLAATQVNLFVGTLLATSAGTGAVSWLQYAFRVMYLPIGLFGVSIATAVLPTVARHSAADNGRAVAGTVATGLALMLAVSVPATVGLLVLSPDIVKLLFERGRFLPSDTEATALALRWYALGLVGYSATRIVTPVFYSLGRSRTPVLLSTLSVAVNLALSLALAPIMGFSGLALATSLAAVVNGSVSVGLLRHHLRGIEGRRLASAFVKSAAASAAMAAVLWWSLPAMTTLWPGADAAAEAVRLTAVIAAGVLSFAAAAKLLRLGEMEELFRTSRRRLAHRRAR